MDTGNIPFPPQFSLLLSKGSLLAFFTYPITTLIPQLNKELAVNRDTGKKHQEAPSEKLVRKFKENPFLPIGGKN